MKRVLLVGLACLGLWGCNGSGGSVAHVPAHNAKLAAQGWEQNAKPFALGELGTTISHALFCKTDKCGGPGAYMVGDGTLSSSSSFGHMMMTIENSPEM